MGDRFRRLAFTLAAATAALALSPQLGAVTRLPEEMVLDAGAVTVIPVSSAVYADADSDDGAIARLEAAQEGGLRLTAGDTGEGRLTFSLLGVVPLRTVKLSVRPERVLVPGGQSVGVAMTTGGVVVVGNSDLGRTPSPARLAGLKSGDVIQCVNGVAIDGAKQLSGQYRLGAWVRDSTAGVGTLTYYDPQTGGFGALGHAIADIDTGVLLPVGEGALYANCVTNMTPSRAGDPGELAGDFMKRKVALGRVTANSEYGVFGSADAPLEDAPYAAGLPVASRNQIHTGAASLLTTVDSGGVGEYACEIVRLSDSAQPAARAMVVRVTDPRLLARSGGIVQGMSGSPIIQDGRIIGAVTHVMVNDPTMGYGICIQTMLDAAERSSGN